MYAVIETGGKQYRVEVGTELEVELLDAEPGKAVTIERVLLVVDGDDASIGRPVVDGASVAAEVVRQGRGDKVIVFKYRPKARHRVKKGHRQDDGPPRQRHHERRQERGQDLPRRPTRRASASASRRLAAAQAAKDAELAAKLAAETKAQARAKEAQG